MRYTLLATGLIGLGVLIFDQCPVIVWVGSTDLTVEFVVRDADTGQSIEGVDLLIRGRTRLEREEREWQLKTDRNGVARGLAESHRCVGRQSRLRFTDTYHVYPVEWVVSVKAPGYEEVEPLNLSEPPYRSAAVRSGPHQALLVVPIALRKSAP